MSRTDLTKEIILLEQRVNDILRQYSLDAWMGLSLSIAQLKSLFFISSEGTTCFRKLADALGVTPPNVTGIVDRLVEQGLVDRTTNPEDRRILTLSVTKKGSTLLDNLRERRVRRIVEILNKMSPEELDCLYRGYTALIREATALKQLDDAKST